MSNQHHRSSWRRQRLALLTLCLAACGPSQRTSKTSGPPGDPLRSAPPQELVARGDTAAQYGDLVRAEQYYSAALQLNHPPEIVLPRIVDVCVRSQRYDAALGHVRIQLRRDPESWQLRYLSATLLMAAGELQEAEQQLRRVLAMAPSEPLPQFSLGELLWKKSENADAHQYFQRYLALAPAGKHAAIARDRLATPLPEQPRLEKSLPPPTPTPATDDIKPPESNPRPKRLDADSSTSLRRAPDKVPPQEIDP